MPHALLALAALPAEAHDVMALGQELRLPIALILGLPLLGFLLNGALALKLPGAKTAVSLIGPALALSALLISEERRGGQERRSRRAPYQ